MNKPDFSGTWKFNAQRSVLQSPAPEVTVFVIDHREPLFRISRTHVFGGKTDTFNLELTTDGKEVLGEHGLLHFRARAYWEGETLVFESEIEQGKERGVNLVGYTLSENGSALIAEEHLRSTRLNYDNRWVLDKQPQAK